MNISKESKASISLGDGKVLFLRFNFPEEIDLEKLLRVDVSNIAAEIVTMPIVLNMMGLMLADVTSAAGIAKMNLETYESSKRKEIRQESTKKISIPEVEDILLTDKGYIARKQLLISKEKEVGYINSIYWSLKSKDDKIAKLSVGISAGDIEEQLVKTKLKTMNMVNISIKEPLIK